LTFTLILPYQHQSFTPQTVRIMRLSITSSIAVLGLLISVQAQSIRATSTFSNKTYTNATVGLAGHDTNTKRTIAQQEAQERVGPWFQDEFSKWESEKEKEPRFWTWYYNKYFPGTANSVIDCKLDDKCSVSSWATLTSSLSSHLSPACSLS
jgi:hypothetical protein